MSEISYPTADFILRIKHQPMINLRLSSFTFGSIIPRREVPAEASSLLVPGSEASFAEGAYGSMLFQEIHAGDITLLYNIYQVKEDIALDFRCGPSTLRTHIALQNDSQYYISGIWDLYLAAGQFNISDAPTLDGTYFMERRNEYRTLHVFFSSGL